MTTLTPWLPNRLPNYWDVVQMRRVAAFRNGADYKDVEVAEGGYPVYGSGGEFRRASGYLYDGDSVLFGRKGTINRPLLVSGRFWTVDTMFFTELSEGIEPRFLYYYATTMPFDYYSTNTALPSMTQGDLSAHRMPLPPNETQRAIADYLDRETARIDTLIEEQQRLIEMLRERRQSAITCATEASSRSTVPLVRCMTDQVDYRGATPTKTDSGIQLVTARNVKLGWIDYGASQEFVDPTDYAKIMRRGVPQVDDLLFTMEAPLGNVALVDREDIALAQRVIKWSVDRRQADPRYLLYAILGDEFRFQLQMRATGSTAAGIKASKLPELQIWLPPLDEQRRIAAYLDDQTAKIDALIAETETFIELSRERRSALITAAVTGQIDVRAA